MLCRRRYYAVGHHKAGLRPLCTDLYGPPAPQTAHHSNIASCSRSHCAPGAFLHFGAPLPRCRGPPFSRFASPPKSRKMEDRKCRITTGCSAITTTTGPLMKSTYCSGIRSYKLSETGQGREKHGDVTVLFSALSVESGAVRRKGETMNIRKAVDYSTMFATLKSVMKADLPQMELYCEIGKAVCAHSEKGAAVAAAEFIKEQYPDMTGFSPRNVRRMRDFWQLYSGTPELLGEALHLNWTQNVVIMEAELPAEERRWYIRQATARNLSKAELLRMIEDSAYLESVLDEKVDVWYNEGNDEISERTQYEEDPVYLSWQDLPGMMKGLKSSHSLRF